MTFQIKAIFSRRGFVALTATLVLILMTGLRIANPDFLVAVRELTFDYYQRFQPRDYQPAPVRIVDIDEASISDIGQWPWPRTKIAELVDVLMELGAATVVFDVIFPEPDRTSPTQIQASLPAGTPDHVINSLQDLPDNDGFLAETIASYPVVLGFAISDKSTGRVPIKKAGMAYGGADPVTILPPFPAAVPSLDILQESASGVGSISVSQDDRDGVIRRVPLIMSDGTSVYPGLATEALRVAQGASGLIVRTTSASGEIDSGTPAITDLKIGAFTVPTTATGEIWVYYTPDRPDRYIQSKELFARDKHADLAPLIEGHIVLVGTSAAGLRDIRATALGDLVPGVSVHAQALEQMINGQFLNRPDWAEGLETLTTILTGSLFILILPMIGSLGTAMIGVAVTAVLIGGSFYLFLEHGLLIDPIFPSLAAFMVFAAATAMLYFLTEREKRFVRQAFSQYLSPDLVTQLEKTPDQLTLGGEIRPMTILFMDIRGFTPISEQLTPTELVAFLNTLLSPLSDAIQAEGGTIDKYIGDSIMAFWNAPLAVPDHAEKACRASLAMLKIVEDLNARDAFGFKARDLKAQTVKIGIGLNSGDACVGNMGSERRFNYSVIGDAVNVASRIESSCKAVGSELLVSEETRAQAPELAFLEAGEIPLKGKSEPVRLYALIGDETYAATEDYRKLARVHDGLTSAVKSGETRSAEMELAVARKLAPALSTFFDRFEDQISEKTKL
ncbi:CHASE2 domain-containing protein [Labrenzia sp. PHM005]|uniref:CHASE2 domain-containing protein n=1 Tax=Labrenzia sp. PHM005 TaxID=2590016 RepID=UPI0011401B55|nr:adenylate/guanylate cyclase domain-containing protein [Labrenzia sp. PHM005]QDG75757.1 adenylate/guanylate cyclase domain-containing protein [Labrenzia sp. PHM005]